MRLDLESSLRQREEDLLSKEDEVIRGKADLEEEVESLKKAGQASNQAHFVDNAGR